MMRTVESRRTGRLLTGAMALCVVHSLCAAGSAQAGCNHLVTSQSDRQLTWRELDLLIAADGPSSDSPTSQRGPGRSTPCRGMSCSSPTPLPASTAHPAPEGADQWGALSAIVVDEPDAAVGRALDEPTCDGSSDKTSVFHPPRV